MSVIKLKTPTTPKAPRAAKGESKAARAKAARMQMAAAGVGAVGVALTGLSLSHLAEGIQTLTASPAWQAWAMGSGIDLGFVGVEVATIVAGGKGHAAKVLARWGKPTIWGTLAMSGLLNAQAFAGHASTAVGVAEGVLFGAAIPAMIYALTQIASALYLDSKGA